MRRTDQEFKAEVLRRSGEYRRRRKQRSKGVLNAVLCLILVVGGLYLIRPMFASGGTTAPCENAAMGQIAEEPAEYGSIKVPGAMASGDSKALELIPMVMIDGMLYMDTGYYNGDTRRCGTYDGQITSQVDGSEIPEEDDQSNFGVGYGYQFGSKAGIVEIDMNGAWRIFATEEILEENQFPQ